MEEGVFVVGSWRTDFGEHKCVVIDGAWSIEH